MMQNCSFSIILYDQRGFVSVRKFQLILTQLFNAKNRKDRIFRQKRNVKSKIISNYHQNNTVPSLTYILCCENINVLLYR